METETKTITQEVPFTFPLEILKQEEESGEFHIVGYAATTDFDMQGDIITDEALKASSLDLLKNSTVLLNHDIKKPIGKVTKAEFDKHGLLIDVLISKTEPEIIQKIKEGILNKFSIRGEVLEREKKYMPKLDRVVNVIKRMSLIEVSLVSVPANPEAKAVGWYISKALQQSEDGHPADGHPVVADPKNPDLKNPDPVEPDPQKTETGGQPMADKDTPKPGDSEEQVPPTPVAEESKPNGKEEIPPADAKPPEESKPKDTPAPEVPEPVSKKKDPDPAPEPEAARPSFSKIHLTLIMSLLDRLAEMGGDAAPIAVQTKALIKWMVGETVTPPSLDLPPAPAKGPGEEEINKRISDEVKKQLDAALKVLPTQRKGLVPPESAADEIKKTFEGLPPEKKLKVALALQQG